MDFKLTVTMKRKLLSVFEVNYPLKPQNERWGGAAMLPTVTQIVTVC